MTKTEHVYAICCQLEVAGDVISGERIMTIEGYDLSNFEAASTSSVMRRRWSAHLSPIWGVKEQKCIIFYMRRNVAHES